tara:strand:- start:3265 stop:3759 length:495 start_codon:yes stop_codon:yes gene_type:complete
MVFTEQMKLIDFWFPNDNFNKFWFDKSKDDYINKNFNDQLIDVENDTIIYEELSDLEILTKILFLDQISRSIYRNNKEKILDNDKIALKLSLYYLENRDWNNIKFNYLIFYLMPLRHTFKKEYYDKIFEILLQKQKCLFQKKNKDKNLYDKFYNVTLKIYKSFD